MKSSVSEMLPSNVRQSLLKFGGDLSIARRKRRLTVAMMCERLGVSKSTWQRMEKGDPTVSMGAYAQALFVLGLPPQTADKTIISENLISLSIGIGIALLACVSVSLVLKRVPRIDAWACFGLTATAASIALISGGLLIIRP